MYSCITTTSKRWLFFWTGHTEDTLRTHSGHTVEAQRLICPTGVNESSSVVQGYCGVQFHSLVINVECLGQLFWEFKFPLLFSAGVWDTPPHPHRAAGEERGSTGRIKHSEPTGILLIKRGFLSTLVFKSSSGWNVFIFTHLNWPVTGEKSPNSLDAMLGWWWWGEVMKLLQSDNKPLCMWS